MAKKILMLCGDYDEDYETMGHSRLCWPSTAPCMLYARTKKRVTT